MSKKRHKHHEINKEDEEKSPDANNAFNLGTGLQVVTIFLLGILIFQVMAMNTSLNEFTTGTRLNGQDFAKANSDSGNSNPPKADAIALSGKIKGDPNAPVEIIEWSDFQCPFCSRFYRDTLPQIEENYIKTGKVKLTFKQYPLGFHEHAQKAAEASECANEQGKFWEMHNKLFENQQSLSVENYKKWASELKLDTNKFNNCLDSGKYKDAIQKEENEGAQKGIKGTPGFLINGKLVSGAQPYANFKAVIDAALNA